MGQVFEFIGTEGSVTDILSDAPRLQEKKNNRTDARKALLSGCFFIT